MTPPDKETIRRAAVRMAAKTAALALTVGCSGGGKSVPSNTDPGPGTGPAQNNAQTACTTHLGGLATAKPNELPDGDPYKGKPGIYGAFKDPAARALQQTISCCNDDLKAHGASSKHRWECCAVLESTPPADGDTSACTPWGPPCPPEMFS
jgi:hypothetical protein